MNEGNGISNYSRVLPQIKNRMQVCQKTVLFILTFVAMLIWLLQKESMILASYDAQDIWKTITTFDTENVYLSYVLYKGALAVYPYVWLYRLSRFFRINEFFFVMVYHALLYAYITILGIPFLIEHLTRYTPRLWQRVVIPIVLFYYWEKSNVLDNLMVDLPSCAIFFISVICVLQMRERQGLRKYAAAFQVGIFCNMGINISGQYSISMILVLLYALCCLIPRKRTPGSSMQISVCCILIIILGYALMSEGLIRFDEKIDRIVQEQNAYIAPGSEWLGRGLIYMSDKSRLFPDIYCARGDWILADIYGSTEVAEEYQRIAEMGAYVWSVAEYLANVIRYPVDYIMCFFDRFMVSLSIDRSILALVSSYALLYLAIYTLVRMTEKLKTVFQKDTLLPLAAIMSVAPNMVLTVEMRNVISMQALVYGVAILGPMIPTCFRSVVDRLHQLRKEKNLWFLRDANSPWGVVLGCIFVLFCMAHYGSMLAQTPGLASATLYANWLLL